MTLDYKTNPAFIEALDHFGLSIPVALPLEDHLFVTTDEKSGHRRAWDIHECCRMAGQLLFDENMAVWKLKHLQDRMRESGMADLYKRWMGEDLPAKRG